MSQAEELAAKLRQQSEIDDPFTGPAPPSEVEARSRAWPTNPEWSSVELVAVTEQGPRRVEEYLYTPAAGGKPQPIGILFTTEGGAPKARLYGRHQWVEHRGPIVPLDPSIVPVSGPDDVLGKYFAAIKAADLEATLETWEDDGYLQHSYGEVYKGRERLKEDFSKFFKEGGISLKYCTKTDDGRTCVFEAYMPHGRTALAVYARSPRNKMAAARLYL